MLTKMKKLGKWGIIFYIGYNIIGGIGILLFSPTLLTQVGI